MVLKLVFRDDVGKAWDLLTILILSQTALFLHVCTVRHLKILCGKEKLLVTSKYLFFPEYFLPFPRDIYHFCQILNCCLQTLSVWKHLKFVVWERVKSLRSKETFCSCPNPQHFRKVNQMLPPGKGNIFSFPSMVLNAIFLKIVKTWDCVALGLKSTFYI